MSSLNFKVLFSAVDQLTAPLKSIQTAFTSNTQTITENQKALQNLSKTQQNLNQFAKLQSRVAQSSQALSAAQAKVKQLGDELKKTAEPTEKLSKEMGAAQKAANKLQASHLEERQKLNLLSKSLKDAGVVTTSLTASKQKLTAQEVHLNQVLAEQAKREANLQKLYAKRDTLLNRGKNFSLAGGAALGIAYSIKSPISNLLQNTLINENLQQQLRMQGATQQTALLKKTQDLTQQYAGLIPQDLLQVALQLKTGIKNISDEGLAELTSMTALMAKVAGTNAAEMSGNLLRSYHAMASMQPALSIKTFSEQYAAAFATVIKTTQVSGAQLQTSMDALSVNATNLGMSLTDQFATMAVLQQSLPASQAGGAFKAFTENAGRAQQALDVLAEKGDNPTFVRLFDAKGGLRELPALFKDLRARYGEKLDGESLKELQSVFSNEGAKFIATLYQQTKGWQQQKTAIEQAGSAGEKYLQTLASGQDQHAGARLQILQQRLRLVKEELGTALIPALEQLLKLIIPVLQKLTLWMEANPKLAKTLGTIALTLGTLAAVIAPVLLTIGALTAGFGLLVGALPAVITGITAVTAVLLANPIGLIITGIATAALLIYNYWEPISAFFSKLWQSIIAGAKKALLDLTEAVLAPLKWINNSVAKLGGKIWASKTPTLMHRIETLTKPAQEQASNAIKFSDNKAAMNSSSTSALPFRKSTQSINTTLHAPITIYAASGMNESQLAKAVQQQLQNTQREQTARNQSILYDPL